VDTWRFERPEMLHLLWALPVLAGLYAYGFHRKGRALRIFATNNVLGQLIPQVSMARQKIKAGLTLAAMACLIVASADPRWGRKIVELQRKGVDVMVCLDVSRSMLAEDIAPNRLERAKIELGDMLSKLRGDRVGLITFAGTPVLACPLTINYSAFRMTLNEVNVQSAPRGGTLIGDAVRLAAKSFKDVSGGGSGGHRAILVITDGEDHESLPIEAARDAFEQHEARVFTVAFGDMDRGARIPVVVNGVKQYLQYQGEEVWTRMNPADLREMALVSSGTFFQAGVRDVDFADIYERVRSKLVEREYEYRQRELLRARFQWFAGLGLLLLVIEALMSDRRPAASVATVSQSRMAA